MYNHRHQNNTLYPQRWQILLKKIIVLSRINAMLTRLPQIKKLPFIIGCEPIRSLKNKIRKIYHLWGKGYFAAVGISISEYKYLVCYFV